MSLFRLLYVSVPPPGLDVTGSEGLVRDIRRASLRNNSERHLTGALAYSETVFAQALEGAEADIVDTFRRILADPRHFNPAVLRWSAVSNRAFADWSMAFARIDNDVQVRQLRPSDLQRLLIEAAQNCQGVRALPGHGLAPEARLRTDLGLS